MGSAKKEKPIPTGINDLINKEFRRDFLVDIKEKVGKTGKVIYVVTVTKDELSHVLTFNAEGKLIHRQMDPLFPTDPHEGMVGEEGFHEEDY